MHSPKVVYDLGDYPAPGALYTYGSYVRHLQRKDYRHLIRHLEKMKTYPNGDDAARNLADYWYGNHKNRPAMKDELLKAGYPQK